MPLHTTIAVCSRRPYHPPVAATSTVGSGGYATGLAKRVSASCSAAIATAAPQWAAARIRNPLFFVGSGRSGTNLLASLLASHPAIAVYPYEANDLWHPSSFPWHRSAGETPPIWQDARRFTEASLESRSPRDDRKVRALLGAYESLKRGSCVVNKSAMVTFMIPHIVTAFPDGRFIHLVRDGRAVALSLAKKQIAAIGRHPEYAERGLDLSFDAILDSGARYWASCIREVDDQKRALDLVLERADFTSSHTKTSCPTRTVSWLAWRRLQVLLPAGSATTKRRSRT